ncbi:DUF4020 domain-containing protein [Candidatus Poriferisodalis sp.]|uniref:DUF4020 domain-containing protein n=1 Tax=Candidatus Poriferisodalis sp. TaxID=3101277 RepID=UPI003AF5BD8A
MRLGGAEIPDEVVSAHRDGSLVLFIGAGASLDQPSNLPLFHDLATRISCEHDPQGPVPEKGHEDSHLDSLQHQGVDVHLRAQQIISSEDSKPNELHRAIVNLATTSPRTRIVTTNYDSHLSSCLPDSSDLDSFTAPNVPAGSDFSGIVYLHGDAQRSSDDLVVTASDFGRAYLSEGWALNFVKKLFAETTVLFIGYSHRDTVMGYLARGLPVTSRRFMLHSSESDDTWSAHGIQPISYGSRGDLPTLLQHWASRASMGSLDHAARVREIVRGVPPLNPEDESYLAEIVGHSNRLHHFTNAARNFASPIQGAAWLRWMAPRPQFTDLFNSLSPRTELSRRLSHWFSDAFIGDPSLIGEALQMLSHQGAAFSDDLWEQAVWAVHGLNQPSEHAATWAALLAQTMPPGGQSHLSLLLSGDSPSWDEEALLLLFERLTEPVLYIEPASRLALGPASNVGMDGTDWWFTRTWEQLLEPRLDQLAPDLLRIADRHLRHAHRLVVSGEPDPVWWDRLSRLRHSIAPHWQNLPRRESANRLAGIDPLIDVARDSLRQHAASASPEAAHYIKSWLASEIPLLQRIGLDGLARQTDLAADSKIQQLIDSGLVLEYFARHEVWALLEAVLPEAAEKAVEAITLHVAPSGEAWERDSAATAGRMLLWIVQHAVDAPRARVTLAELRASFPDVVSVDDSVDLLQRKEPDMASVVEKSAATPLLDPALLHSAIQHSPGLAVDWLRGYVQGPDEPPALYERTGALATVISQYPDDGLAVIDYLMSSESPSAEADQQLAHTVLGTWLKEPPTGDDLVQIRTRIGVIWDSGTKMWLADTGIYGDRITWLDHALNHWAGDLARLLMHCAYIEANAAGAARHRLPDDLKRSATSMLQHHSFAGNCARAVLIGRLDLLHLVDRQWSRTGLLPLLDPTYDAERAARYWECFVLQGQRTVGTLEDGLADMFIRMLPHVEHFEDHARRTFFEHLAAITCFDGDYIDHVEWLADLTRTVSIEVRVEWMKHVSGTLSRLTSDEADAQWTAWMHTYWERRLNSHPFALTDGEATEMVHWTVQLASCFPEAVKLATLHPATFRANSRLLYNLYRPEKRNEDVSRPDLVAEYPQSVAALLTHLLRNATGRPNHTHFLPEITHKLKKQVDFTIVKPLLEAALALDLIRDHDAQPTDSGDGEQPSPSVSSR